MLPQNHPDRIQIAFDDHRLVANAGLLLPVTLAQHNTDPFIFGERFLYSNCGQASKPGLTHLGDGSVIAFGSGKKIKGELRWMLDTVLVVKDSVEYRSPEILKVLDEWAPDAFLVATGGLLAHSGRLYRGATPDDPVDGMFSFFPAIPAGGDSGFPRPLIDLPSKYFNPLSWQSPKGLWHDRTAEELRGLWESLVSQVRAKGLVIGTHASQAGAPGANGSRGYLDT